jgi:hypothetical protein
MKVQIPAIRYRYSDEEMRTLSPEVGMAALFGVPRQFFKLTEAANSEGFNIYHQFDTIKVPVMKKKKKREEGEEKPEEPKQKGRRKAKVEADYELVEGTANCLPTDQRDAVAGLLSGPLAGGAPSLIVVNAPAYFAGLEVYSGESFLYHMMCATAIHRIKSRDTQVDFMHLGIESVDQQSWIDPKSKAIMAWGPITDDFSSYHIANAIKFLVTYSHYTRVLLLSVKDMLEALQKLRIDVVCPDFVFCLAKPVIPVSRPKWSQRVTEV